LSDKFLHDSVVSLADGAVQRRTILSATRVDILTLGQEVLDRSEVTYTTDDIDSQQSAHEIRTPPRRRRCETRCERKLEF
jgi:hypothetical protein